MQFTSKRRGAEIGNEDVLRKRAAEVPALKADPGHHPSALKLCDSCIISESV